LPSSDSTATDDSETSSSTAANSQNEKDDIKEAFFPGVFLATCPARFVRPVKNLE